MIKINIKNLLYLILIFILIFIINITINTRIINAQNSDNNSSINSISGSFKVFILKGDVAYNLPNFKDSFPLIDGATIPSNCVINTGKNGYLEINSEKNLIRILPSSILEFKNNELSLISGTIYINTIDNISITINKLVFKIYKGIVAVKFSDNIFFNFINDAQIEFNSNIFKPAKTDRIYSFINNNLEVSKNKFPLDQFKIFNKEIENKINFVNNLIDIFFERIYYLIEKNNSFLEKIDSSEKKNLEIENKLKLELENLSQQKKDISQQLNKYSDLYQIIQEEILEYNFNKFHYLEYYFQMRNYFEYFKRLIEYSNDIYDLDKFDEFPDYSSKSSFFIVYDKIKSFKETVRLSYQLLEMTYVNILNTNSPINKSFSRFETLKNLIKNQIDQIIKESYKNVPDDINSLITQTFLTQLECKTSTNIYINRLYDILLLLNNEYIEDETAINKFFSLDDIIYKSLYLEQSEDIKNELMLNFNLLEKNITILNYLITNSKVINDLDTQKLLISIIQFYPTYNEDYLSVLSIVNEIKNAYNKYKLLLKNFIKQTESNYYQNIFSKEVDKYLDFIIYLQNEIYKTQESEKIDIFYLNSIIDIQKKLISITYSMYDLLKTKFPSIQFPKKLYIDQQKEYIEKLTLSIQNLNTNQISFEKNLNIKKDLIIRIVAINQILEDMILFKESIKDYEHQKSNIQKSLLLYNLSITKKSSFSAQNFDQNSSIIWQTNQLIISIDQFLSNLNTFENRLSEIFENLQVYYLMEDYQEEDLKKIENYISMIQKYYNEFAVYYFALLDQIYQFTISYNQIQANNDNILINDIIKDLKTFIFLYKSKFESFRYILSVLRVIFSIAK